MTAAAGRRRLWALLGLAGLLLAIGLLVAVRRRPPAASPRTDSKKILFYRSPMNPNETSPAPAKDSMGMDMAPVYAEPAAPSEPGAFQVSARRRQEIGVRTAPARVRPLIKTIRTVGRIAYDPELYRAQEEHLAALAAFRQAKAGASGRAAAQAKALVDSSRLRLRLLGLSDRQIGALGRGGRPDQGLLLSSGQGASLWLYAQVYESDLPVVRVGQPAEASSPSLPGEVFAGTISAIDPVLDPKTRSARVRVKVTDRGGRLRPDMYLNAVLSLDLGPRLTIPREAVLDTGVRQFVFVDLGDGYLGPRNVVLGERAEELVEVREGLHEGEMVVTSGNFLIDSESRLKAALEAFEPAQPQAPR
ncbi:MAG: efflux RND transporter periplasmic adaptor subunit [Elusimicrobia bacterium]|nr:efflux RND transporter periplasmic adaptor subunit [Elusimicrobiota bacterium]